MRVHFLRRYRVPGALLGLLIPSSLGVEPYIASQATCSPEYGWMNNPAGYSPCLLYARLAAGCTPSGSFILDPLPPPSKSTNYTSSYPPPKKASSATACVCNAVAYSLIQACAVCQGGEPVRWTAPPLSEDPTESAVCWARRCPPLYTTNYFPLAIPEGLVLPDWATRVDVTVASGTWDLASAQSIATSPPVSQPTPTPTPTPEHHSDAPVIAGSVIGALLFAALLIGLALVYRRYRRTPPSRRYSASASTFFPTLSSLYPASWGRTGVPMQRSTPFDFTMTYSPVNTTTDRDSAMIISNSNRLSRGSSDGPPQITIRYEWEPPLPPDPPPPPPREGYLEDYDWSKSLAFWAR